MIRYLAVIVLMALFISQPVHASDEGLSIKVNGTKLLFDSDPFIYEDRTMVPVRAIADVFGADEVLWNEEDQQVTIQWAGISYRMTIGDTTYLMGGIPREMDVVPMIESGRTMLPLRYVADTFGFQVSWDEASRTVELMKDGVIVPEAYEASTYTSEDLLWLARIVNIEGFDIGYEARLAIANVVLNRVEGDEYPDSVYEVIMDDAYAVQFPPAHRESFQTLEPDEESLLVAEHALDGLNNIGLCLYFNNQPFRWKADDLYKVIEGEYFYE